MFYILDLSFLLLSAIEFLRNSAIQVKFIIIIIIIIIIIHICFLKRLFFVQAIVIFLDFLLTTCLYY